MHRLDFDRMDKTLKIYKSPTYNMRQSSCYWVGINNGRIYYIRKSNHWGRFYVNSGAVDESCPYECQLPVTHNWELINGKRRKDGEYTNTSQIGIIDITDLVGNKIIRR
jgi:sugar lactone lactonase YvrE